MPLQYNVAMGLIAKVRCDPPLQNAPESPVEAISRPVTFVIREPPVVNEFPGPDLAAPHTLAPG